MPLTSGSFWLLEITLNKILVGRGEERDGRGRGRERRDGEGVKNIISLSENIMFYVQLLKLRCTCTYQ